MKKQKLLATRNFFAVLAVALLVIPSVARAQAKATVVEEIIARVNNDIITMSDYQRADQQLREEVAHDCTGCPADKVQTEYRDQQKDLLRGLIDQSLLVQRAKDMGISVETDLIKRLDEVRKQNGLNSMEELEKAVEGSGIAWEDYKTQIRNGLLTQEVMRKEVGSRINIGNDEVKKYYDEHPQEFTRPEQVALAEIFLSTEGKSPEEIAAVQKKAEDLHNRVTKGGEDFGEIAKRYSEGSTAKDQSGDLGTYQRGQLSPQLEGVVFKMDRDQITDVIQTKTGFEILKIENHYQAGLQPMDKVENEIMNKLYMQKMQPTMRDYLAQLRQESYVMVKPGYVDSAAVPGASVIQEVQPTPDTPNKKKEKKKLPMPKVNGQ
ncbi:MAG: peptidylprolyl isomerase [Candidatus Acidiferrales bacterium]